MTVRPSAVPTIERVRRWRTGQLGITEWLALGVAALALAPIAYLVWRALEGGQQSLAALQHPRTATLVLRSVVLAAVVALSSVLLALPLAWLTERVAVPGRRLWATLLALPLAVPSYLMAYAVVALLGPRGALAGLVERLFGVERLPELYGFWGAWLTLTLVTYPYSYLPLRAAFARFDTALEDAARTLGTPSPFVFWRVTLPLLRPALMTGVLLSALYTLADFGAIAILRYPTLTFSIYNQYRLSFDRSAAAALALLLVGLSTLLVLAERYWRHRAVLYRATGVPRPAVRRPLDARSWPLLLLAGGVLVLGLGLPFGVAGYWLVRALAIGETLPPVWDALRNSLSVGVLAAVLTVALAFPVARAAARGRAAVARMLDIPLWIAYGLPGIVMALALVSLSVQALPWLYQTLLLLLLGYALRFLPEAAGTLRSVLSQQNPRWEEAARTLGRRPWRVWLEVQLPLAFPGVVSALVLVFLTTVKELPVTLLLSPIGFTTLATAVWGATTDAFWSHAAVPALVLLLVGVVPMGLLSWWQERRGRARGV